MERRKAKKYIMIIIILLIGLCASFSYIVYDNFLKGDISTSNTSKSTLKDKNKVEEKKDSRPKELNVNGRLVRYLHNKVVDLENTENPYWMYEGNDNFTVSTATEEQKMKLVAINLDKLKEHFTTCEGALEHDGNYTSSCKVSNLGTSYSKSYIEYVYKDIFGQDATLNTNVNIQAHMYRVEMYKYIQGSDSYVKYMLEGGGTTAASTKSTITKAIRSANEIKLYEQVEAIDLADSTNSNTYNYTYTFKMEEDDMYTFVSRKKE